MTLIKKVLYFIISLAVVIILIIISWSIKNKLDWNKRVSQADMSELYGKQTNGVDNNKLIDIARQYIKSAGSINWNGKETKVNDYKLIQTKFNSAWFVAHAPEGIVYNHDSNNQYLVQWLFLPDCEKKQNDLASRPRWFSPEGFQCVGGESVQVIIDKSLNPQGINIYTLN